MPDLAPDGSENLIEMFGLKPPGMRHIWCYVSEDGSPGPVGDSRCSCTHLCSRWTPPVPSMCLDAMHNAWRHQLPCTCITGGLRACSLREPAVTGLHRQPCWLYGGSKQLLLAVPCQLWPAHKTAADCAHVAQR